ncbi:MAG: hypothetical protein B6D63_06380 [Candidatus Latescibacteria bacterium 4484_7]|nr:MAG: hypothetical protein B6D63_06380 [Candidatus Latescibacteria bacterium 4484_7]
MQADALYFNGTIYSLEDKLPIAQAIAVADGRIVDIGSSRDLVSRYRECAEAYDLHGMTVIPGLTDAHGHFFDFARSLLRLDLSEAKDFEEVVKIVAGETARRADGEWVLGRGWDQNRWDEREFPTRRRLDEVTRGNPVYLERSCMHAALVNSVALRLAGIGRDTRDPEGGRILRDRSGEPAGVLLDEAMKLVSEKIPPMKKSEMEGALVHAAERCLSAGLVGVHEMGVTEESALIYEEMYRNDRLPLRITGYFSSELEDFDRLVAEGPIGDCCGHFFSIVGVKFFSDGSLGARTAALLEDYSDDPGNRGILVNDPDELYEKMFLAHQRGFQIAVHAIGDRANRVVLDLIKRLIAVRPVSDARFRIEHAQVVSPEDIRRFGRLGVVPSMQFVHCISDMDWVERRLGPRRSRNSYAWKSFLDEGCTIAGGSDFPVESHDPLLGIYAATTGADVSGKPAGGWHAEQTLSVEEAIRAFTINAAYAAREDRWRGSLRKGAAADFVVLSDDIMNIHPHSIPSISVVTTVIGGKIAYSAEGSPIG